MNPTSGSVDHIVGVLRDSARDSCDVYVNLAAVVRIYADAGDGRTDTQRIQHVRNALAAAEQVLDGFRQAEHR